jgi:pimeloyl-ACP methyl ester carboxylesterase
MIYALDGFELDSARDELRRNGERRPLERQVYDVLAFLVENHERVVTKRELFERVWGDEYVSESAFSSRITTVRGAVGDDDARNIDIVDQLARVRVPTLVMHARDDQSCPFPEGRELAAGIPNARFVPLEGRNHILLEHEPGWAAFLREMRAFLEVGG